MAMLGNACTTTLQVADTLPSCVVAVMIDSPAALAVIWPEGVTKTIWGSLLVQMTSLFEEFFGNKVATSCCVAPSKIKMSVMPSVMPDTGTSSCWHDAQINPINRESEK